MIELIKEKRFLSKDEKFKQTNKAAIFEKFKVSKFHSVASATITNERMIIYLGMNTGIIATVTLFKQKSMFHKFEDYAILKCPEDYNHNGPVNVIIAEVIEGTPIIFTGGYDGGIKMWWGDPELKEKDMLHHIKSLIAVHKRTVAALAFSRSRSLWISSSSDMTMKIFRMKDKFDKILNPCFECISEVRDFHILLNKDKDLPYSITSLSLKETDIIELYAGDTKGRILFYHYVDDNYIKYRGEQVLLEANANYSKNNFVFVKAVNLHKQWGTIKVLHSIFDSVIYSAGFDNHIDCYNVKNSRKIFEIANSTKKSFFTSLAINYYTQELIVGDDIGNITFIKIFNKAEFKIKALNNKILFLQNLVLFNDAEHVLVLCEDHLTINKVSRTTKVSNVLHHDAELIKWYVIEPIKDGQKIIEDAKVLSCAYDNVIKIWDFLTMDCINWIHGPELAKKNVEVSTICYLNDSALIAVGTDTGNMFFWDWNRSEYLKNDYEKYVKHKAIITCIIAFIVKGKDENNVKECFITSSIDGFMFIWEVQKTEIKQVKKNNIFDNIDNAINFNEKKQKGIEGRILDFEAAANEKMKKPREIINFKCMPQVKSVINTMSLIKQEWKINVLAYSPYWKHKTIYTGSEDYYLHLWDYAKGNYIDHFKGSNSSVTCLIFDKNVWIAGGIDGFIDVFNISDDMNIPPTLLITLKDANCPNARINDLIMLANVGILVSVNNAKKIQFWKYEKETLLMTMTKDCESTCIVCLESYGKLWCGTKEKTIMEIDLVDAIDTIGYKHDYIKFPFLKTDFNHGDTIEDKKINNFQIMNSLTKGLEH